MSDDVTPTATRGVAWWRVALLIGLAGTAGALLLARGVTISDGMSDWTYNEARVVVDEQSLDAQACESEENGIEVRYGDDAAVHLQFMADGRQVAVLRGPSVEHTARHMQQVDSPHRDRLAFVAEFEAHPIVTVEYEYSEMGWCS